MSKAKRTKPESALAGHPAGWSKINKLYSQEWRPGAHSKHFPCSAATLNRFAHRFRLAKQIGSVQLHGYQRSTSAAYAATLKLFLAYSAFEMLMKVAKIPRNSIDSAYTAFRMEDRANKAAKRIGKADPGGKFLRAVKGLAGITEQNRKIIDQFISGRSKKLPHTIACVRHGFVHGELAATPAGVKPAAQKATVTAMTDFLFNIMDTELARRADA